MVKILHTADLHLGSPFSFLPPDKAALRREELLQTFAKIVRMAKDEKVDMLLVAGDLFDAPAPPQSVVNCVRQQFENIPEVRVFLCGGNHDYGLQNIFPKNVLVFSDKPGKIVLHDLGAAVYGVSFGAPYSQPLLNFSADDENLVNILLMHGDTASQSDYNSISLAQLAQSGMDYVALGHVHVHTPVMRQGATCYAFCGSPEGRGFDECGEMGVYLGTVDKHTANLSFVPTAKRRHFVLSADAAGKTTNALTEEILEMAADKNALYKIEITGETDCVQVPVAQKLLSEPLFYCKLVDKTTFPAGEATPYSLKGQFLAALEDTPENLRPLAQKFGLMALEGRPIVLED